MLIRFGLINRGICFCYRRKAWGSLITITKRTLNIQTRVNCIIVVAKISRCRLNSEWIFPRLTCEPCVLHEFSIHHSFFLLGSCLVMTEDGGDGDECLLGLFLLIQNSVWPIPLVLGLYGIWFRFRSTMFGKATIQTTIIILMLTWK